MSYKAVVFDLDGTLISTSHEHRRLAVGWTLKDLGVEASPKMIDKFWFEHGRDDTIRETFHIDPKLFWDIFHTYDTVEFRSQFTKPYDDLGFISELKRNGYKTGIVTTAPDYIASFEIGMIGKKLFDAVVGNLAHTKPKPHPYGLEKCLEMLGVKSDEAIYVGNGEEDVETARNAHVLDVMIDRGEYQFPGIKPSLLIHSLYELRPILNLVSQTPN